MRVNIYSQELTKEVELVKTKADTGIVYYGVRMYLASPDVLHHTSMDDDRSAITLWIPNAKSFTKEEFGILLSKMAHMVFNAPDPEPN